MFLVSLLLFILSPTAEINVCLACLSPKIMFPREDDSNTSDKDIFETLQTRKSKWTPPEGQLASLDFFIKKCRHDIRNKLNVNRNTRFSNLSSEERAALEDLSKRKDLIVVWPTST